MKKIKALFILLTAVLIVTPLFAACGEQSDKLQVYASIYPLYFLAESIGGERAEVFSVLPAGGSAHSYEPSLRQSGKMRKADVLILIGLGMEEWAQSFINSLRKNSFSYFDKEGENDTKGLLIVDTSRDVDLIEGGHAHDDDHDGDDDDDDGHEHGLYDPHTWTSIKNMRLMAQSILAAFIAKDAQNAEYYQENFDVLDKELIELEREYQNALASYNGKSIVVSHKAFSYLCADYGLNQIPIQISSEQTIGLRQIAQLVNLIVAQNITALFWDNASSTSSYLQLIKEGAAKKGRTLTIETLSPCETISKDKLDNGENYFTVMRDNLAALLRAFAQNGVL